MKKAVLLHGTDGSPTDHWFPWLRGELELHGYEIFAPELPGNHTPDKQLYEEFLKKSAWDFTDNVLVGHSSGATTVLNLLSADWFPHVRTAVLVSTFLNEKLTKAVDWYEPGQFDNLFLPSYDPVKIKTKADNFIFVHSDDDPYCDIEDAHGLCKQVSGKFVQVEGGGHLGGSSGVTEIPGLLNELADAL